MQCQLSNQFSSYRIFQTVIVITVIVITVIKITVTVITVITVIIGNYLCKFVALINSDPLCKYRVLCLYHNTSI